MNAENYPDTMNAPEAPAAAAQDGPSLWQRSLWPLLLFVALPLLVLSLTVEHLLPLEGDMADLVSALGVGVAVSLILVKVDKFRQQRREAEVAAGRLGEGGRPVPAAPPEAAAGR